METPHVLQIRRVAKTYMVSTGLFKAKRPLRALDDVSLEVEKGTVLGLVGESGCGKTTLAKLILGLEKPTDGELLLDGKHLGQYDSKGIARRVQPVFQDPYSSLNPRKSIAEIISLPLSALNIGSKKERDDRVDETMEFVGLPPRTKYNYPNQLSGGQRQRVAVARALITRPELVLCDEPTSALDVSVQAQILNLLMDLRAELGLTYVFISHDLAVVEHMATRVAVMYLGRIVESADTAELFRNPRHPYTQALLNSVLTPEPGLGLPKTHLGIAYPNPIDPPSGCAFHPRCPRAEAICQKEAPKAVLNDTHLVECHFLEDACR
jgi:peptide/nickel transport system ATP-binding protein